MSLAKATGIAGGFCHVIQPGFVHAVR